MAVQILIFTSGIVVDFESERDREFVVVGDVWQFDAVIDFVERSSITGVAGNSCHAAAVGPISVADTESTALPSSAQ